MILEFSNCGQTVDRVSCEAADGFCDYEVDLPVERVLDHVLETDPLFNDSLMNDAVFNFKRYEDSSLEYTGISRRSDDENVGLFSTVISKKDYEELASAQSRSMQENPFKNSAAINLHPLKKSIPKENKELDNINISSADSSDVSEKTGLSNEEKSGTKEIDLSKFRIGTAVLHKKFGKGKVTGIKSGKVMVSFDISNKTFLFPDAIEQGFLTVIEW